MTTCGEKQRAGRKAMQACTRSRHFPPPPPNAITAHRRPALAVHPLAIRPTWLLSATIPCIFSISSFSSPSSESAASTCLPHASCPHACPLHDKIPTWSMADTLRQPHHMTCTYGDAIARLDTKHAHVGWSKSYDERRVKAHVEMLGWEKRLLLPSISMHGSVSCLCWSHKGNIACLPASGWVSFLLLWNKD